MTGQAGGSCEGGTPNGVDEWAMENGTPDSSSEDQDMLLRMKPERAQPVTREEIAILLLAQLTSWPDLLRYLLTS